LAQLSELGEFCHSRCHCQDTLVGPPAPGGRPHMAEIGFDPAPPGGATRSTWRPPRSSRTRPRRERRGRRGSSD
jgi:hypothetical protein